MSIICKQCGYENPDGARICEMCTEDLTVESDAGKTGDSGTKEETVRHEGARAQGASSSFREEPTVRQEELQDDGYEYSVTCPESHTKTILFNGNVKKFYCEGCKKEHEIDNFLWTIDRKEKRGSEAGGVSLPRVQSETKGNHLWLEEMNSHYRIDIDELGGSLGRYGKYGAEFFQSRSLLMVSGEHCVITNEFGNWVIRHVSKTNQTKYDNKILEANEPNLLEDGKILTLANTVSFIVRIG